MKHIKNIFATTLSIALYVLTTSCAESAIPDNIPLFADLSDLFGKQSIVDPNISIGFIF